MITQYTITGSDWTPISTEGQEIKAWIDEDRDGVRGQVDVRIHHTAIPPLSPGAWTEGKRLYSANGNENTLNFVPDSFSDVFYAKCANPNDEAVISVDARNFDFNYINSSARTVFGEVSVAQLEIQQAWNFPYKINPLLQRTFSLNGGSVVQSGAFAEISTGSDPNGVAFIRTNGLVVYNNGVGMVVRFANRFDTPQPDSLQLQGVGDFDDGWFFGYDGLKFGILRRKGNEDTWYYQEDWNDDKFLGLNPQKLNVYEMRIEWLGGGGQEFYIEKENGESIRCHVIQFANQNDDVSVNIPSLPLSAGVSNSGNTVPITLRTSSAMGGSQGEAYPTALTVPVGFKFSKAIASGTNYLFSFFNPDTYEGKENRLYFEPISISVAADGTKDVTFTIIFGASLTNPVYQDVEPDIHPIQYDVDATAYSGGYIVYSFVVGKTGSKEIPIKEILEQAKIWPENRVTIIAESANASNITIAVSSRGRA